MQRTIDGCDGCISVNARFTTRVTIANDCDFVVGLITEIWVRLWVEFCYTHNSAIVETFLTFGKVFQTEKA